MRLEYNLALGITNAKDFAEMGQHGHKEINKSKAKTTKFIGKLLSRVVDLADL